MDTFPQKPKEELIQKKHKGPGNCPFLGTQNDRDIWFSYASQNNYCHRPKTPQPVLLAHQDETCLIATYTQCPIYQETFKGSFPGKLRGHLFPKPDNRKLKISLVVLLVLVGGLAAVLLITNFLPNEQTAPTGQAAVVQPTSTEMPQIAAPTELLSQALDATALPAINPTASPTPIPPPTETPAPSPTPFPTPGPGFGTPFGPADQFLIYIVEAGESFTGIAAQYGSAPEVLVAINPVVEGASLWAGRQIVVPIGVANSAGLPQFEVVFVQENTTLDALAAERGVEAEQIRFFNDLGPDPRLPAGRWLIVPLP